MVANELARYLRCPPLQGNLRVVTYSNFGQYPAKASKQWYSFGNKTRHLKDSVQPGRTRRRSEPSRPSYE
jgi:hypothetical protein